MARVALCSETSPNVLSVKCGTTCPWLPLRVPQRRGVAGAAVEAGSPACAGAEDEAVAADAPAEDG